MFYERFDNAADTIGTLLRCWTLPPMIEFLELRACSVRIKGRHLNGARAAIATLNNGTVQWQDRERLRWFQASGTYVRSNYVVTLELVAW